tara:strand:+ start:961 stop:1209 length:249 start_codon:yes stop_codon:yes gene_type:complete
MQDNRKKVNKRPTEYNMDMGGFGVRVINGNLEPALRLWKKKLKDSGKMEELRDRKEYTKPTTKRRRAKAVAIRAQWLKNNLE